MLGIQSSRPKGLGMVEAPLGRGHLGRALMEKGAVREETVSKGLEVAWHGQWWARPDLCVAQISWGWLKRTS